MGYKTFTVTGESLTFRAVLNAPPAFTGGDGEPTCLPAVPIVREVIVEGEDASVSDGYHEMREVYRHRMAIFAALLNTLADLQPMVDVWKSKHHSDCVLDSQGASVNKPCCSMFSGDFVAGIGVLPGKQITYHLPLKMWDDVRVPELEKAPEWDGHTSAQVLERLKAL